jgi:hypothetical protein
MPEPASNSGGANTCGPSGESDDPARYEREQREPVEHLFEMDGHVSAP